MLMKFMFTIHIQPSFLRKRMVGGGDPFYLKLFLISVIILII